MARPTLWNEELQRRIVERIEKGVPAEIAAQAEGVAPRTFRDWMRRGEAEEVPFSGFCQEVARARSEAEAALVETWLAGDDKGESFGRAKAAAEFLRLTKRRYGEKVRIQVADELEELLSIVERICRPEDFTRVLEAIAARDRGEEAGENPVERAEPVH